MIREEKGEISDDTDAEVMADYKQHEMDKLLEEQFDQEQKARNRELKLSAKKLSHLQFKGVNPLKDVHDFEVSSDGTESVAKAIYEVESSDDSQISITSAISKAFKNRKSHKLELGLHDQGFAKARVSSSLGMADAITQWH